MSAHQHPPALALDAEMLAAVDAALARFSDPTEEDRTAGMAELIKLKANPEARLKLLTRLALEAMRAHRHRASIVGGKRRYVPIPKGGA